MSHWKKTVLSGLMLALAIGLAAGVAHAQSEDQTRAEERAELDQNAETMLNELFVREPNARGLYDRAYGYAVFTNYKFAIGIVAGGGSGVAVEKDRDQRTYMNMGTAGIAAGLGGQKYHLVMLFETATNFNEFVSEGWEATASANAVVGEAGANVQTNFVDGVLVYPITEAGLMLNLDISGTRFWADEELNADQAAIGDRRMRDNESDFFDNRDVLNRDPVQPQSQGEVLDNRDVLEYEGNIIDQQ